MEELTPRVLNIQILRPHFLQGIDDIAGSKVRITSRTSSYVDHTGVVYQEPAKDSLRFWYMVKFESNGLPTVDRFAEEQLMEVV